MKLYTYKLRAEAPRDIGELLSTASITELHYERLDTFGDCMATFKSNHPLAELQAEIAAIEDGHVMLETVKLATEYTGNRDDFVDLREACTACGADTSDGEGYDGLCGNCADKAHGGEL